MTAGTLKRLGPTNDLPNRLRTEVMRGEFVHEPTPGHGFAIMGESLTEGLESRYIITSVVKSVEVVATGFIFETANSRYELILDPV